MNDTNSSIECPLQYLMNSESSKIGRTVALTLLAVLSLVGNVLVLLVLYKNKNMRTATNIFIANMALSDLIFPLIVIPKEIALGYSARFWLVSGSFGSFLCKLVHFLQDVSTSVSIQSHMAISCERFYAVVFPLRARQSNCCVRAVTMVMTWVVAMAYSAPYFYTFRLSPVPIANSSFAYKCVHLWEPVFSDNFQTQKEYYISSFTLLYACPLAVVVVLYTVLLIKLRRKKVIGNDLAARTVRETTQNKRVVRLAITIVAIFALSWAPVHTLYMLVIFQWNWNLPCEMQVFWFSAFYIAWLNSVSNPMIYFIFSENYWRGLRNVLSGCLSAGVNRILPWKSNSVGTETMQSAFSSELRETPPRRLRNTICNDEMKLT